MSKTYLYKQNFNDLSLGGIFIHPKNLNRFRFTNFYFSQIVCFLFCFYILIC